MQNYDTLSLACEVILHYPVTCVLKQKFSQLRQTVSKHQSKQAQLSLAVLDILWSCLLRSSINAVQKSVDIVGWHTLLEYFFIFPVS